jgi:mRNA-degrading endonuclease RelE of RelBE toxin-antitoxin system
MEGKNDTYRIRIGDIRIIYEISLHEKEINILTILPRSSAYKR